MSTSARDKTLTFLLPFRLTEVAEVLPAGQYVVETDEEMLHTLLRPAYRRLSTSIRPARGPNSNESALSVDIDPAELAPALAKDALARNVQVKRGNVSVTDAHQNDTGAGQFVFDGCKRWLELNANELTWTALIALAIALAGLIA